MNFHMGCKEVGAAPVVKVMGEQIPLRGSRGGASVGRGALTS